MTTILLALIALIFSTGPILLLCLGDPKRRRSLKKQDAGMVINQRRILAAVACVPGIACAFSGDAAAFFIWFGGCALVGWAAAFCFCAVGRSGQ